MDDIPPADKLQGIGPENGLLRLFRLRNRTGIQDHGGPVQVKMDISDAAALFMQVQPDMNLIGAYGGRRIDDPYDGRFFHIGQFAEILQRIPGQRHSHRFGAKKRFAVVFNAVNRLSDADIDVAVASG